MRTCGLILWAGLLGSQAVALCKVPQPRLVCAEYFRSRSVVIATLAGVTPVKDTYGDLAGAYYSMTVDRELHGQVPRLFRIYESNDTGRATFDWKIGDSYLIFLRGDGPSGAWLIDGCGNSGPAERRQKALQQIEAIDPTSDRALIQGAVRGLSSSFPLSGVRVEARGLGTVATSETMADGTFEMHVAPGKYQVTAISPGKTFVSEDLSYEDPDELLLENGGCAQIQFVEAAKAH